MNDFVRDFFTSRVVIMCLPPLCVLDVIVSVIHYCLVVRSVGVLFASWSSSGSLDLVLAGAGQVQKRARRRGRKSHTMQKSVLAG